MNKVIALAKRHKILVLVFLLIGVVALFIVARQEVPAPGQPSSTVSPTGGQSTVFPSSQPGSGLQLIRKFPEGETISSPWSVEPVAFMFNKSIKPETIEYSIVPNIESKLKFESTTPDRFSIIPTDGFEANQKYTITISSLEATTGERLQAPVQTSITRIFNIEDFPPPLE